MAPTPKKVKAKRLAKRNKAIAAAYVDGATVPELSKEFDLSTIMVYRYLKALGVTLRQKPKRPMAHMSDEVKATLAEGHAQNMAVAEAERIVKMKAYRPPTWRRTALKRHVVRVLAVQGGERLDFMDRNPIAGVFR